MTVGLTGGIGSGKSTVAIVFKALGIPVFDADLEAKALYSDQNVKEEVVSAFGKDVYSSNEVNLSIMSEIVFSDPEKLRQLESILYPALTKKFSLWREKNKESPYKIKEAALLIEKESYKDLDNIILVTAPKDVRIERVLKRSSLSYEDVKNRIDQQLSDDKKLEYSDHHIQNFGDHSIIEQVFKIHSSLLTGAKEKLRS